MSVTAFMYRNAFSWVALPEARITATLSLCPQFLLGDQALHEFGSFLLIGLNALVQEHFAHLRNRPLLVLSDPLDVLPQGLVHSEFRPTPAIRFRDQSCRHRSLATGREAPVDPGRGARLRNYSAMYAKDLLASFS
jgi:hypothetical protein